MMSVIQPVKFSPSMLVSTTATEPNPSWATGTSYSKNDIVVHVTRQWESLVNNNTDEPGTTESWLDIGPCNKCAMFDGSVTTQTFADSPLVVEIDPGGDILDSLALLNLVGQSIRVEAFQGSEKVYDSTKNLEGLDILDWWDYYFLEQEQVTAAVFDDLPLLYGLTLKITLEGLSGSQVAIGQAVFGTRKEIGCITFGAQSGIIDYSRKETNEFGDTIFVKRAFADEFSVTVFVQKENLNSIKRMLRDLRATPCLWIGSDDDNYSESLIVYGWYRRHNIAISYPTHSVLDIEIEGLT
jgi:hypothetical protein